MPAPLLNKAKADQMILLTYCLTTISNNALAWTIKVSALIFFICTSLRYALFQLGAFDLGIFDQAVYLISRCEPPISSFLGFHILGDHAAVTERLCVLAVSSDIYLNLRDLHPEVISVQHF